MEYKKVENETEATYCDRLLTELIQSERRFDPNVRTDFQVRDFYKNSWDKPYNYLEIAMDGEMIIGYLFGYIKRDEKMCYYKTTQIEALYIQEEYRHRGIAATLIDHFMKWSQSQKAISVEIGVYRANEEAMRLYRGQGFEIESYRMIKNLAK